ncbi:protein of unknown function [Reichenbachiella faecimaris]|uniref:DUF4920 domain-containing protein n=1 Tax=Reichenbachiella faecimaris TaxID=692418 RepID=A0A1W2GDE6_REIFA|nr:DUF4920 domain-containing protein [Reichenbachiella faecimaris]SMD34296.1 protein of unknown function [Reichenbachiella faecimaris]
MKNIVIISILCISLFACGKKNATQEPQNFQTYGESFDQTTVTDLSTFASLTSAPDSVMVTIKGEIEKTCAVKGCWMQLKANNDHSMRVTFKDYGFFVPKSGAEGKTAIVNGYCVKQETSVDELRHYAQDAGESEEYINSITTPKTEYNFVASGVIIED